MIHFQELLKGLRDSLTSIFAPCTYKRVACSSVIHEKYSQKGSH